MIIPGTRALVAQRNGVLRWNPTLTLKSTGAPYNFTGWTGRLQFRASPGATGPALLDLATNASPTANGSFLSFPNPTTGQIMLFVATLDWSPAFVTADPIAKPAKFFYDLMLTDPGGDTNAYVTGTLTLLEGVTR